MHFTDKHPRYISFLLASIIALSVGGYPFVASMTSLLDLENRPFAVGFRITLLAMSILVIFTILTNRARVSRSWVWLPVFVFWTMYIIRLLLDTIILSVPLSRDPAEYWIWALGGCLIPMIALMVKPDSVTNSRALLATFWLAALTGVLVLLATRVGVIDGISRTIETGRLELSALNPISAGHLGGSLVLVATHLFLVKRRETWLISKRAIYLSFVVIGLVLLISSGSRGAFAGMAVAFLFFFVARFRWKGGGLALVFLVSLVAASYQLANYVEDELGLSPISRLVSAMDPGSDVTASSRYQRIGNAWGQFLNAPLLGKGLEEIEDSDYPHNVTVESFMATGIVGGMAFVIVILIAAHMSWQLLKVASPHMWVGALCIQYLIGAQFSGALWGSTVMWAFVGAVFAVGYPQRRAVKSATALHI